MPNQNEGKVNVDKKLAEFLASLDTIEADELWLFLDGCPTAIKDMVIDALLARRVKNA